MPGQIVKSNALIWIIACALLLTGCLTPDPTPDVPVEIRVVPLLLDEAATATALPDGRTPCGIGEVDWGRRVWVVREFGNCYDSFPDLEIYCMGADGRWTADTVQDLKVSMGYRSLEASFQQTGICGIFTAE